MFIQPGTETPETIPKVSGDMETMFILDLLRQKREKVLRMKKDEMIHEMAIKKKKQMEDAKRGIRPETGYSYNYGGFVGVQNLTSSPVTKPKWKANVRKVSVETPTEAYPPTERTDLLIMGMIRDEKEKKFHLAHQVRTKIRL